VVSDDRQTRPSAVPGAAQNPPKTPPQPPEPPQQLADT